MSLPCNNSALGSRRLRDVHLRVDYLMEKYGYNENKNVQIFDLCKHCESVEDLDVSVPILDKKQCYINCSGVDWICQAKFEANKHERILWNQYILMRQEDYSQLVIEALQRFDPRIAINSINQFNKELKCEQPHMTNTTFVAEEMIFNSYCPMTIPDDVVPVPPLGKEYYPGYVKPIKNEENETVKQPDLKIPNKENWIPDCDCKDTMIHLDSESCIMCGTKYKNRNRLNHFLNPDNLPTLPTWENVFKFFDEEKDMVKNVGNIDEIQNKLDMARAKAIVNSKCTEILGNLAALTGMKDACQFCSNMKRSTPDRIIECSGLQEVCIFKHEFFKEWPACMFREKGYTESILKCSTKEKYQKLLDKIFSVKYFERAMKIKEILDSDVLVVSPHLAPVIKQYNCLLYRYYWPHAFNQKPAEYVPDSDSDSEILL